MPGIHINLISALVIATLPLLSFYFSPIALALFIIAMSVTHIFLDFIPSCFLGIPEGSTILSVFPAHRLLLKGRGYEAARLSVIGSFLGIVTIAILTPVIFYLTKDFYPIIKDYIAYILIIASIILIIKDKRSRFFAFIIFSLSGILGLTVLTMPNLNQPLLPLLSGLFGISILTLSILDNTRIPPQTNSYDKINKKETSKAIISSLAASLLIGFLPGMTSSESAILATSFFKRIKLRTYLILLGSINSMVMILSFIAVLSIEKARSGSAAAIQAIIKNLDYSQMFLFIAISLIIAIPAAFLTLYLAKRASYLITRVNYRKLCLSVIALIFLLVAIISGPLGILILLVSSFLGMLPSLLGIRHSHLMGCLILPVIAFLLM